MKKLLKEWGRPLLALGAVLVLAGYIRISHLLQLPIFGDEAIYVRWAQVMRAEPTLRFLPLSDGKQPLFMWVVIPALKLFADPLVAGRMVSVLAGLGTVVGVYVLGNVLFKSKSAGLVSSLFWALSPFSVFYNRLALVDALLAMFGVWFLTLAALSAKTLRLDMAMLTGFVLGFALLTKSPALFYVLLLPTTGVYVEFANKGWGKRLAKLAGLWLVTLTIGYGMYNILRLGPNFAQISARNLDYVHPLSHLWTNPLDPFLPYLDRTFEWFSAMGPWILLVFAVIALWLTRKTHAKEALLLTVWWLAPVLVNAMFAKGYPPRYVFLSYPFLIVLAGGAFATFSNLKLIKKDRLEKILFYGLIIFVGHSVWFDQLLLTNVEQAPLPRAIRSGYLEEWTAGAGIKETADYLRAAYLQNPKQKIVVGTEGYFGTLPDGLQLYLNDLPDITVIGTGLNFTELPSSLLESKAAGNKTYLVVNSSRLPVDASDLNLKLIAAYPKAFRPEGIREYVQFGPRDTMYLFEVLGASESN